MKLLKPRRLRAAMHALRLFPLFVSFLLSAAHFQRAGQSLPAILCLLAPCLLCIARPWSARILQVLLFLAAAEWFRTLIHLVRLREETGQPWTRLAVILGIVTVFTAASALLFRLHGLRKRYGLPDRSGPAR